MRISVRSLRRLRERGELVPFRPVGQPRYDPDEVRAYLERTRGVSHRREPAERPANVVPIRAAAADGGTFRERVKSR